TGRSYFLTRPLLEVVFPEAGLAGFDLRWERRRQWLQTGAIAGCAVLLLLASLAWWLSAANNRRYLGEVTAKFGEVQKQVTAVRAGARSDLTALLPTLTGVHGLAETPATTNGSVPWSWRFGLYQGAKLETASGARACATRSPATRSRIASTGDSSAKRARTSRNLPSRRRRARRQCWSSSGRAASR